MKRFAGKIENELMTTDCPIGVDACIGDAHCTHDCYNYIRTDTILSDVVFIMCRAEILEPSLK